MGRKDPLRAPKRAYLGRKELFWFIFMLIKNILKTHNVMTKNCVQEGGGTHLVFVVGRRRSPVPPDLNYRRSLRVLSLVREASLLMEFDNLIWGFNMGPRFPSIGFNRTDTFLSLILKTPMPKNIAQIISYSKYDYFLKTRSHYNQR